MEKAKVYYTDFRTKLGEGLPTKLKRLIRAASWATWASSAPTTPRLWQMW